MTDYVVIDYITNKPVPSGQSYPLTKGKADALKHRLNNPARRNIYDRHHKVVTAEELRRLQAG